MSFQNKNFELAKKFKLLGDLTVLEKESNSAWKSKAYYKAADLISSLDIPIESVSDFTKYAGVGESISEKIQEILSTGSCSKLDSLLKKFPNAEKSLGLTVVPGVGIKKAIDLYKQGITSIDELAQACTDGKISNSQIIKGVELAKFSRGRLPIYEVLPVVTPIFNHIKSLSYVDRIEFAGSTRRGKETVKDVDLLICCSNVNAATREFAKFGTTMIIGSEKARIMVDVDANTKLQVDLLFTSKDSWGSALAYFTGSKEHNVALRTLANAKGLTLNEHGFYKLSGERVGGAEEDEIYKLLGLPYCPPELRESDVLLHSIPDLVCKEDIKEDWHMHTYWSSDAKDSFEDMALAAKAKGLHTIGVSDHTEKLYGWDPAQISKRKEEARKAEEKTGIKIYAGCETGINKDGTLDWSDEYLNQMDFVIASIHRGHATEPVERLLKAIEHPKVKLLGHPTGRLLGRREVILDQDWKKLFDACVKKNIPLEINGARLDLPTNLVKQAKECGCKFMLNSDAHATNQLWWQNNAISIARRGGLTKADLILGLASELSFSTNG